MVKILDKTHHRNGLKLRLVQEKKQQKNHANAVFKANAKHALRVKPNARLENSPSEGRVFVLCFGSQSFICCLRV